MTWIFRFFTPHLYLVVFLQGLDWYVALMTKFNEAFKVQFSQGYQKVSSVSDLSPEYTSCRTKTQRIDPRNLWKFGESMNVEGSLLLEVTGVYCLICRRNLWIPCFMLLVNMKCLLAWFLFLPFIFLAMHSYFRILERLPVLTLEISFYACTWQRKKKWLSHLISVSCRCCLRCIAIFRFWYNWLYF